MDDTIIPERPSFLDRSPGDTGLQRRSRRKAWRQTPAAKKQAVRDAKRRAREPARPIVLKAVEVGAETLQAIRKATESAKRSLVKVPLREGRTLHHDVRGQHGAGRVILRSAPR
ncbi:hypothetical protein LCGC14_2271120, partial [marine sediment metagenome]